MVQEARREAARSEYFTTREAARRNKLEVQLAEQHPNDHDFQQQHASKHSRVDCVHVNPRVHREWWGKDADAGSMCSQAVVHKPCKAAVVRQQAMQRQEEAAQRRREELRVAAQELFEFRRQQRRQHSDARRITDMDVDASNGVNTVTVRSGAMNCAAEPKDMESTSTGLDHWTPRERGAKASRDVAEAKHGNVLEALARERQRTHLERKALEQRARNGMT